MMPMNDDDLPLSSETGDDFFAEERVVESSFSDGIAEKVAPYLVLARKYRPKTFDDLIGQEALVRILRRAFEVGRVAHAFMLTGVRGVGKTTTARIIARALNCVGVDGQGGATAVPCGVCPNCTAILAERHPDVLEMDAASHTGVDDVREIIEASRFRPMQARMKVFIIDEVHMLSRNAFNALLKTLEEPPAQITFVFATTELRKVPVTVLSRCQRFDLQRVPQTVLATHFKQIAHKEGAYLESEALSLIARAADGSVRDGLSLLDQAIAQGIGDSSAVAAMLGLADRGLIFDLLDAVMEGKVGEALTITDRAYIGGADLGVLLSDLMGVLHLLSRIKAIPSLRDGGELPEMERVRGGAMADRLSMSVLGRAWQILLKGLSEVEISPDRRQATEMVLVRLCHASLLPTPDKLIRQLGQQEGGGASSAFLATSLPSAPTGMTSVQPLESRVKSRALDESSGAGPCSVVRLVANGGTLVEVGQDFVHKVSETTILPVPKSWREMVALVRQEQLPWLHGILRLEAHVVRFSPPDLLLRIDDPVVRRRALKELADLLEHLYPGQWRLGASQEAGAPSLDEQGEKVVTLHRYAAERHPLVQAILETFPGARLEVVRGRSLDDYGLPPEAITPLCEDVLPDLEFAPFDADSIDENDLY